MGIGAWPSNVPREETIFAFQMAYTTLGYAPCQDGTLEEGFEKVVIYASQLGPTHAAWQRPDGTWTSKMGIFEDIDHGKVDIMNGPTRYTYGRPKVYMKRSRRPRRCS